MTRQRNPPPIGGGWEGIKVQSTLFTLYLPRHLSTCIPYLPGSQYSVLHEVRLFT